MARGAVSRQPEDCPAAPSDCGGLWIACGSLGPSPPSVAGGYCKLSRTRRPGAQAFTGKVIGLVDPETTIGLRSRTL